MKNNRMDKMSEHDMNDEREGFQDLVSNLSQRTEELFRIPDAEVNEEGVFYASIIVLRNSVIFPRMISPVFIEQAENFEAIQFALENAKTAVILMPKNPEQTFAIPAQYPYLSVCTTSTHDMTPLRAWWEEDRALTQRYYNQMLGCEGDAPYFCEPWVVDLILSQHMKSPAMLAILPLQDYMACDGDVRYPGNPADERINIPAIPRHYWRFRMHCTLESLIANDSFNQHIRTLVEAAGRNL